MDTASNDIFATSPSLINTYQRYWTGAVVWLESILKQIGISQDLVDLTVMPQHTSEHCCYSAMLVVKTDPTIPFPGEIVTALSTDGALCAQMAAYKMIKRMLAHF